MKIKRILVPVDFSDSSLQALAYAVDLAQVFKAKLLVLHVLEPVYYPGSGDLYGSGYDMGLLYRELERAGKQQLARLAAQLEKRGARASTLLRVGTASHVILDTARTADVIIMSTHGRTGLAHALLGSVAENVARHADRPVLTVRATPPRLRRPRTKGARRRR